MGKTKRLGYQFVIFFEHHNKTEGSRRRDGKRQRSGYIYILNERY